MTHDELLASQAAIASDFGVLQNAMVETLRRQNVARANDLKHQMREVEQRMTVIQEGRVNAIDQLTILFEVLYAGERERLNELTAHYNSVQPTDLPDTLPFALDTTTKLD